MGAFAHYTFRHALYAQLCCVFISLTFVNDSKIKSIKQIYNEHDLRHSFYCMTCSRSVFGGDAYKNFGNLRDLVNYDATIILCSI